MHRKLVAWTQKGLALDSQLIPIFLKLIFYVRTPFLQIARIEHKAGQQENLKISNRQSPQFVRYMDWNNQCNAKKLSPVHPVNSFIHGGKDTI